MTPDQEMLSVENCDREPIHIPGNIQPFGAMLAGSTGLERVDFASANLGEFLGIEAEAVLDVAFPEVLDGALLHDLRNVLSISNSSSQRLRAGTTQMNGRRLEVYAHRSPGGRAIVEFEPAVVDAPNALQSPVDRMRMHLARAADARDLTQMLRYAAAGMRDLTGYDRVKAYVYDADGSGEVLAEARGPGVDSFLGLRYPAADVPAQARALQIRNPIRILSDVGHKPIPVLGHQKGADPLDMSLAQLRGVSPIHVQYLRNMGVQGTLTVGLVVGGRLWGMLACHHYQPWLIDTDTRVASELFGQMLSLVIQQRLATDAAAARERAANARRRLLAETDARRDLINAFPKLAPILSEVIDCDGVAVTFDDKTLIWGSTPTAEIVREIAARKPGDEDLLEGTESLVDKGWLSGNEGLGQSSGAFIVRATAAYPLQLIFFRDGKTRSVRWAGRPDHKIIEDSPFGPRLSPRASFEAYLEEQEGIANPWTEVDRTAARELQILLTQITAKNERAQLDRHKEMVTYQRQQDLMIAELNHRVKNILALIRSLSRQARSSSSSIESYATALEQRIAALAAAHDLAVGDQQGGVSLRRLLETECRPYLGTEVDQVLLSGPVVGLRADVAPMLALVIHEVVTNAAKYGALSNEDGVLRVRWSRDDQGLVLRWREMGGPTVTPPERQGFGTTLLEKAISYEFDGTVETRFPPAGFEMDLTLPEAALADLSSEPESGLVGEIGRIEHVASGRVALLVEDNLVLAMDMVDTLTRLGAERIETAGTIEDALLFIKREAFGLAVLDMNLRGAVSFDVARQLKATGVPFIFVTGYGSSMDIPVELRDVPILTKPVDDVSLARALGDLLGG